MCNECSIFLSILLYHCVPYIGYYLISLLFYGFIIVCIFNISLVLFHPDSAGSRHSMHACVPVWMWWLVALLFVFLLPYLGSFIFSYYERVSGSMHGAVSGRGSCGSSHPSGCEACMWWGLPVGCGWRSTWDLLCNIIITLRVWYCIFNSLFIIVFLILYLL